MPDSTASPTAPTVAPSRGRDALRFFTCGSVDDGKSTLIGRLIHDSAGLLADQASALQADSRRFGTTGDAVDLALLLDGLEAEREQGITIDVAYRFFATPRRSFVVADTPGNVQYTRNMATGASNADLAVLLVDATRGVLEQTRRHAAIVSLLGIRHVVLAVNKIDLLDGSPDVARAAIAAVERDVAALSDALGFASVAVIPLSALHGDNVARRSDRTPWYDGPTLLEVLECADVDSGRAALPFRLPVQWVNRPDASFRGFSGTVVSGHVAVGDRVAVSPSGHVSTVARIVTLDGDLAEAAAGRAVTLTLADEIDVARGDLLAAPKQRPVVSRRLAADLVWLDGPPAAAGAAFLLKCGTATVPVTLARIVDALDLATLARQPADSLPVNGIGRAWLETLQPVAFDPYGENRATGGFILVDRASGATVAAGMAVESLNQATNVHHQPQDVTPAIRAALKQQQPLVVWLTGLPGSGKSTIANALERRLVAAGRHTMLLDGDNLRQGLNADLGFDAAARTENVRRVGEVATLMADAGLIVIVALVSPFRADRDRIRALLPEGRFLEVFVDAPSDVCRERDVKGLYRKAAAGLVQNVTGLDQGYEPPLMPTFIVNTGRQSVDACVNALYSLVSQFA